MNKILRNVFLVAVMLVCGGASAQTYLWQEDFSSYSKDEVPSDGDYNYVCVGSGTKIYAEKNAGGTAPELLVAKNKGSFSATVKLNGATGTATLAYKKNKYTLTVTATNATVGDITQSGNDYSCPITFDANATEITLTFTATTSNNVRLDDIKLYQGEAKKPAGLSWGTAARTVTIGSNDNVFPTLTNANSLAVTYASSDTDVATIAEDGTITLVAAGKTDITASFAGNDEYEAGAVTYALTVKAAPTVDISNTPETAYTVAKAKELIAAGEGLDTKVYVGGTISSIKEVSTSYGNATYNISDDGTTASELVVFRGYYLENAKFTAEDQIKVGDVVIVYGQLTSYNGTDEVNSGNYLYAIKSDPTSISSLSADEAVSDAPAYNLAGQKVTGAYKGVVVKGGKKFVQK